MAQDLTEGSIGKKLLLYFLPIAAGTLLQQLYNAADAVIVGKFVGTTALAAVGGSAANITNLLIGFFVALSGGCTVIIAQLYGARDNLRLQRATGTAMAFCLLTGVVLTVIGLLWTPQMLALMQSPENTMQESTVYLRIVFLGVTAQLVYNIEAGILRAVGDSRSPFIYLLITCVLNIVLDLVFVAGFRWGVAGAAAATIASQIVSALLATVKLCRCTEHYRITLRGIRIDMALLGSMLRIGIPAGLQNSMYSVSNIILQVAVNLLGTTAVASWSLSGKIDGFYWACSNAAGLAVMNFAAQNYGAHRNDRIFRCVRLSLRVFLPVTVGFSVLLITAGCAALPLFTNDPEVIRMTTLIMRIITPFYFVWTFIEIISGILRGVGDAVIPVIICGIGVCLVRAIWIFTIYQMNRSIGTICVAYPVSWSITAVAFIVYYLKGSWRRRLEAQTL